MLVAEHILARRRGYSHHGIYIGDRRVIHFTGEPGSKKEARVTESPLAEFESNCEVMRVTYRSRNPPEQVLRLARSQIGCAGYNLVFNNCEHFAVWCISGDKRSLQVEGVAQAALAATPLRGLNPLGLPAALGADMLRRVLREAGKMGGLRPAQLPGMAAAAGMSTVLGVGLVAAMAIARGRARMEPFQPDGPFDYSNCQRARVYPGSPKLKARTNPGRER